MEFCADTPRKPSHEGEVDRSGGGDGIIAPAGVCSRNVPLVTAVKSCSPPRKGVRPPSLMSPIVVADASRRARVQCAMANGEWARQGLRVMRSGVTVSHVGRWSPPDVPTPVTRLRAPRPRGLRVRAENPRRRTATERERKETPKITNPHSSSPPAPRAGVCPHGPLLGTRGPRAAGAADANIGVVHETSSYAISSQPPDKRGGRGCSSGGGK